VGSLGELPFSIRMRLKAYRWRRIDPVPWTPLQRPLAECRLALVSSAGLVLPGQEPFGEARRGRNPGFREIPAEVDVSTLVDTHSSKVFDHTGVRRDPNLAFPIDRLHELARAGRIAAVAPRHLSFMGGMTSPERFLRESVPEMTRLLVDDCVDAALLVPV
jgi:D-proline reductase (dithiol) PrdB